jgi:cbb3-type cytochrome c oxidase subunit III
MNRPDVSPQESRENPDPRESERAVPHVLWILTILLVAWCSFYIVRSNSAAPAEYGDQRTLSDLQPKPKTAGAAPSANGAAIFAARCAACHQAGGTGLPGTFPPLAGSNWVKGTDTAVVQILLHGVQGTLTVNGVTYNGAMPAFGSQLSDAEIAAVITYVRGQWGNNAGPVDAALVSTQRATTAARGDPWHGDSDLTNLH